MILKNLANREKKEICCLKILKIEKRKRNENTILQLEREKHESFLLEIETLVNDWQKGSYLKRLTSRGPLCPIGPGLLVLSTIASAAPRDPCVDVTLQGAPLLNFQADICC